VKHKRRLRTRGRGSAPPSGEAAGKAKGHRVHHPFLMFFSLLLLAAGGLAFLVAREAEAVVRRFSGPAIQSAADLSGAEHGRAVILGGRIEPQNPVPDWRPAIYDHEHLDPPGIGGGRYGGQTAARTWVRRRGFHPSFTLLTGGRRVSIINHQYAVEHPTSRQESDEDRYFGFQPYDKVLVIGEIAEGGVAARKVFGGTRQEFRKGLEEQRVLIPSERALGYALTSVGAVLLALWVAFRVERRLRGDG
jgi:hypothetical protein